MLAISVVLLKLVVGVCCMSVPEHCSSSGEPPSGAGVQTRLCDRGRISGVL